MSPAWTKHKDNYHVTHDGHEGVIETSFSSRGRIFHVYLDGKPIATSGDLQWAQAIFIRTVTQG